MKKIIAVFLILLLLFSLSGCSSTKLNAKNLLGTWEAEITVEESASLTGEDIKGDDTDMPQKYVDRINNLKLPWKVVFYKDGSCETKISKSGINKLYDDMLDIMMDFYKEEGLLKMYQALGANVKTNEELEDYFKLNGSTTEEVLEILEKQFEDFIDEGAKDLDLGKLKDGYYTKKGKFTVEEDAITFKYDDEEESKHYCKLTDKNTLLVNEIYYDFEDYKVDITYKRVK